MTNSHDILRIEPVPGDLIERCARTLAGRGCVSDAARDALWAGIPDTDEEAERAFAEGDWPTLSRDYYREEVRLILSERDRFYAEKHNALALSILDKAVERGLISLEEANLKKDFLLHGFKFKREDEGKADDDVVSAFKRKEQQESARIVAQAISKTQAQQGKT